MKLVFGRIRVKENNSLWFCVSVWNVILFTWEKEKATTPIFLLRGIHGQRSWWAVVQSAWQSLNTTEDSACMHALRGMATCSIGFAWRTCRTGELSGQAHRSCTELRYG